MSKLCKGHNKECHQPVLMIGLCKDCLEKFEAEFRESIRNRNKQIEEYPETD